MVGLDITEAEYREIERTSYSLLSSIDKDKHKALTKVFYPSIPTIYGVLTESILFGDYVEDDYYIFTCDAPTDKLKLASDAIFKTLPTDKPLIAYRDKIITCFKEQDIDYWKKKDPEWIADKFIKEVSVYWEEWRESIGKIRISNELLDSAKLAVRTLKSHQFTRNIFNKNSFFNVEKHSQVKLTFEYLGREFKAMLDWLVIDHDSKTIKPYDLKTGGKSAEEFEDSFFYWRYDIQALLYTHAVYKLRDDRYPGYTVDPFKFVFISRNDEYRPLVWTTTFLQLRGTLKGFTLNDVYYKGVKELLSDLDWYKKKPEASYSREIYESNGEVLINNNIKIE